jgi:hypothetical protein
VINCEAAGYLKLWLLLRKARDRNTASKLNATWKVASFGWAALAKLSREKSRCTGKETRFAFRHLQRGAPTTLDRILATRFESKPFS